MEQLENLPMAEMLDCGIGRNIAREIDTREVNVEIIARHADGTEFARRHVHNVVTTAGKTLVATLVRGTGTGFSAIAIGTGTTPEAITDTTLGTETMRSVATLGGTGNQATYSYAFAIIAVTMAVTESGIFNNNTSGGTMLARVTFAALNLVSGDSLTMNWTVTVN